MAAETILIPVAKQILGKAADLATEQLGLLWNFKPELWKLKGTVSTIQAVLRDAEEKQCHNNQVRLWLEKLSDAMYDADDLLDDLSTEARRKAASDLANQTTTSCWSVVCFLFSSLPKQVAYDLKMAHAIKAIREKLDYIATDKETLHLEVHGDEEDQVLPSRETDSCPPMIVVGREDAKKDIIQLLLNSNCEANVSVVPIVGMGGMGKTTLAQIVIDDHRVQAHFDVKAWVYVSQDFNVKVILGKMLRSIGGQGSRHEDMELDALQIELRGEIRGRRFLFVLDDVWEESNRSWETLGKYLTVCALGSKVLVTTRSAKVAEVGGGTLKSEISSGIVEPYLLKGLSEEECWNLLVKRAFPRKVPQDPLVQEIGKQILSKCDGVPLAVSTIAGVLVDSSDPKTEWSSFLEKGLMSIINKEEEDPTMSALRLSFNHLPFHMKHCFTYCKLFPKGFDFDIQMLVQLWVAQGYIESEDKGFDCFRTLWWRSFFQEVEMDWSGNLSSCRMHDLMHDLADSIAGETIIRSSSLTGMRTIPPNARHLAIYEDNDDELREEDYGGDELGSIGKVRTLICFKSLSNKELKQVLNTFLCLRVLIIVEEDSSSDDDEECLVLDASTSMNSFYKLKHLRYLGLSTGKKKLPDSVTNLVNLQVLDLNGCRSLEELPRNIKKLINLKHLDLSRYSLTHMPKGIGELKLLQTLPIFVVAKRSGNSNDNILEARLDELKGLNVLWRELVIKGVINADSSRRGVYLLKEKLHLQSLVLDWGQDDDRDVNDVTPISTRDECILEMLWPHPNLKKLTIDGSACFEGLKLPNWLSGLTNLVEFSLNDCERCEYLPQLHQMSSLKKLTIKNCPLLKGINDTGDHCDSSLDHSTTRSPTVEEEEEYDEWPQFHCLSYLNIGNCPKLTRLPTFPTAEGKLELENASLEPFARTMKMMSGGGGGIGHPLSKLTKLSVYQIGDDLESLAHPDSNTCLVSLRKLTVRSCDRGMKLPGSLCSSIYLREIYLEYCSTVEYLPPLHELPSLGVLSIAFCPELKGCWWKKTKANSNGGDDDYYNIDPSMEEEDEDEDEGEWPHFRCLSRLTIQCCPKLTQMPLFPDVEGELMLWGISSEALVRTMKMKPVAAATTALVSPLSKLTELTLFEVEDLESLPEEGLPNLTSLKELTITDCPRLASLPPAMRHLTSLQTLAIYQCPPLTERRIKEEDWPNISHIPCVVLNGETLQ